MKILCNAARLPQFQAAAESQRVMDDLVLATEVKTKRLVLVAFIEASPQGGIVNVKTTLEASTDRIEPERKKLIDAIESITN